MRHGNAARCGLATLGLALMLAWCLDGAAAERRYTVELIVFEQAGAGRGFDSELWPEIVEGARMDIALSPRGGGSVRTLDRGTRRSAGLLPVPAGELAFGGATERLRRAGYRPLLHTGWRQEALDPAAALPIKVAGSRPGSGAQVRGTVRLYVSRQLHLDAHLVFDDPSRPAASFLLQERRRLRSGELHYFDHPMFGMLVRVIRYEPPGGEYLPAAAAPKPPAPAKQ